MGIFSEPEKLNGVKAQLREFDPITGKGCAISLDGFQTVTNVEARSFVRPAISGGRLLLQPTQPTHDNGRRLVRGEMVYLLSNGKWCAEERYIVTASKLNSCITLSRS